VGYLAKASDAVVVDVEPGVDEIERFEDIADAAAAVEVESPVEDDVFCAEGVGGGDESDHAVGDGDAVVVGRVDGVGVDGPGIGGRRVLAEDSG